MSTGMEGRAEGHGRVYQAQGDQHIIEHHHHAEARTASWGSTESVRQPTGGRPPVVLRDRTELMERLRAAVAPGAGDKVFVLHGMGGCGKTAVARALFQYATTEGNRIGLWVNTADRSSLRSGMLAVAADRGATEGEVLAARNGLRAPADLVWERLDQSAEPWLLVLDNADDPSIVLDGGWLRTSPRGTVLVTTRRSAARWWPHAELHHVGVLPREAAAQVLSDLAPESGTLEDAAEIADRLGRLPLALTLAGGFLSHQVIDPWTMAKYGRHLDGHESVELIDLGAVALPRDDARHLVSKTWQLSLDALTAQGVPESTALLRLLACYGSDPLPLTLLNSPEIDGVLPRARAEMALRGLLDQSLTTVVDAGVRCVQTHGVLLASVMAGTPREQVSALVDTANRLLSATVPAIPERGRQDLRLRLFAPHVVILLRHAMDASMPAEGLDTAVRVSTALHRTGDYLSAWELISEAAALAEPVLGPEHRLVLTAHARAGRALARLGRFEESEALHRRVLAARERLFGPDDPDTLDSCAGLNFALSHLGRGDEGLMLLRRAAAGRERVLGPEHPLTLRARALLLEYLPASELAAELSRSEVPLPEQCVRALGPDHDVTLFARLDYVYALFMLERIEEAHQAAPPLAQDFQRRFGPDYPVTLSVQTLEAQLHAARGDLDAAIELMTSVAESRKRILGADHPYTADSYDFVNEFRKRKGE